MVIIFNSFFSSKIFLNSFLANLQIFVLNPPQSPLSAVATTHKYVLSIPFPTNNFGALAGSLTVLVKLRIILLIFSLYGLPFSASS